MLSHWTILDFGNSGYLVKVSFKSSLSLLNSIAHFEHIQNYGQYLY